MAICLQKEDFLGKRINGRKHFRQSKIFLAKKSSKGRRKKIFLSQEDLLCKRINGMNEKEDIFNK